MVCIARGQTTAPKAPTAAHKAAPKSAVKAAPKALPKTAAKSNAKGKRPVAVRRPVQQQPSVERSKEIQQALADKGSFPGTGDGNWGPESVAALKRFPKDQNLASAG